MQVKPVLITLRIASLQGCPLSGAGFSDSDIPDVYLGILSPVKPQQQEKGLRGKGCLPHRGVHWSRNSPFL